MGEQYVKFGNVSTRRRTAATVHVLDDKRHWGAFGAGIVLDRCVPDMYVCVYPCIDLTLLTQYGSLL